MPNKEAIIERMAARKVWGTLEELREKGLAERKNGKWVRIEEYEREEKQRIFETLPCENNRRERNSPLQIMGPSPRVRILCPCPRSTLEEWLRLP